jgi:predicted PurR-regulated permease PerM
MSEQQPLLTRGLRWALFIATVMLIIAGLREAAGLLRPFLAALFLTMLSLPLLGTFKRIGFSNAFSVTLTAAALIAVLVGIGALVGGSINEFTEAAPYYQQRLEQLVEASLDWAESHGVAARRYLSSEVLQAGAVIDLVGTTLTRLALILSNTALVLLTTIFLLAEMSVLPERLERALGQRSGGIRRLARIRREVQRYLVIKTLVSLVTGVLAGVLCAALGIDFPLLWGLLAFLFNYVPNLGSIIASIPAVVLALVQYGPTTAIVAAIGYAAINVSLGSFAEPLLMGRRLGMSTLVVFLSLVFWYWVWGPVGMLLSVPLTMILKITLEDSKEFRWVALLIDSSSAAALRGAPAGKGAQPAGPAGPTPSDEAQRAS